MINNCLFPAAGYGILFLPATKAVPKEMLPILTKPLLQYGVEGYIDATNHFATKLKIISQHRKNGTILMIKTLI